MRENEIKKLSEREHCLLRPNMYIGSTKKETFENELVFDEDILKVESLKYTSGLLKIVNEIIDNSVDEALRTNFKFSNKIEVTMGENLFCVKDNGRGIPIKDSILPDGEKINSVVLAWTHTRAGANFTENNQNIGTNGVGSSLTNFFSKKFIGETCDGKNKAVLKCENNAENIDFSLDSSNLRGTKVISYPDFKRFEEESFNEVYFRLIETRLMFLKLIYPKINFSFNSKPIWISQGEFLKSLTKNPLIVESNENFTIAVFSNDNDDINQISILNGLILSQGGTHVDFLYKHIITAIKDKLQKKYPDLKNSDIRNKISIVCLMRNFTDAKFDSQTKTKLTNSQGEISNYFNFDIKKFTQKILKEETIIRTITDYYSLKKELESKKELRELTKAKKFKSEKFTEHIGKPEMLFLCEGFSAVSGLMNCLGRNGIGYFELKGKIQNITEKQGIKDNKELKDLFTIISTNDYNKIVIATDKDLDGIHISSLLLNYFWYYHQNELDRIYIFNTPIAILLKNSNVCDYVFDFQKINTLDSKKGEVRYMKGLGSWTQKTLSQVIKKEGLDSMLLKCDFDKEAQKTLSEWFKTSNAEIRKKKIIFNNFSLIKT